MLQPKEDLCTICYKPLHPKVAKFSWERFGKPLCVDCQMKERIKENPKLGKFINKQVKEKYEGDKN